MTDTEDGRYGWLLGKHGAQLLQWVKGVYLAILVIGFLYYVGGYLYRLIF